MIFLILFNFNQVLEFLRLFDVNNYSDSEVQDNLAFVTLKILTLCLQLNF